MIIKKIKLIKSSVSLESKKKSKSSNITVNIRKIIYKLSCIKKNQNYKKE